jgi:hypothetical protein
MHTKQMRFFKYKSQLSAPFFTQREGHETLSCVGCNFETDRSHVELLMIVVSQLE